MMQLGKQKKTGRKVKKFFSDIRLKTNIEKVGTSASGINIYKFNYIGSSTDYVGVMAQEVLWATEIHSSGYLMVDDSKVDGAFKRIN